MMRNDVTALGDWPSAELEAVDSCPICGSERRAPLHADLVDDTFFTAPGRWRMMRCGDCGGAYLDPRPTARSVGAAYSAYYTHGASERAAAGGAKEAIRNRLRALGAQYAASLACRNGAKGLQLGAWAVRSLPIFRELVDARYRHLRAPAAGADKLLDIGCGSGEFLKRAEFLGWSAEGVDVDAEAVSVARASGLKATVGSIETFAGVRDAYDVVTCNHVIEHTHQPIELLKAIHRILKPGGLLWIETPNIDSIGHALFGRSWRGLEVPRHIAIFSRDALVRAVEELGFVIVAETAWNLQHIRYMFAASAAIARGADPHNCRTSAIPNPRLLLGLAVEALLRRRREFVCIRASKRAQYA